jgi:hypothetical protein
MVVSGQHKPSRIVAVLIAVILMLGPLIYAPPVVAHNLDCMAPFGADCADEGMKSAPNGHPADHGADRSSACCDFSSCNGGIVMSTVAPTDWPVRQNAFEYVRQLPLNLRGNPPFKPPRLG